MTFFLPPKYVRQVLDCIEGRGYAAFLVGGCVRDLLLGRRPFDWDVCTAALPDAVLTMFKHCIPTGLRFGTVTVLSGNRKVEVTSFRRDGCYSDGRRPDGVSFVADLNLDLSRRDFTINAMALNADAMLIDPFGGEQDLKNRKIRCVGDPVERFREDALRMLRALRFSARLDFQIDSETLSGIKHCAHLAAQLAPERIRDELSKILMTNQPQLLADALSFGLLDHLLQNEKPQVLGISAIGQLPKKKMLRWCAFSALLAAAGAITSPQTFLKHLRLERETVKICTLGAALARHPLPNEKVGWKLFLANHGLDASFCAAAAADALRGGGHIRTLKAVLKSGECFSRKRLNINGQDLLLLGFSPGIALGRILDQLLVHVIYHPRDNERDILLKLALTLHN